MTKRSPIVRRATSLHFEDGRSLLVQERLDVAKELCKSFKTRFMEVTSLNGSTLVVLSEKIIFIEEIELRWVKARFRKPSHWVQEIGIKPPTNEGWPPMNVGSK